MSVTPRTRDNRISRDEIHSPSVGDERFPMTCPRCGWPCLHIFPVYWDSPWNEHGGLCGQCAQEAVATFEVRGWPPPKGEPRPEVEVPNPQVEVEGSSRKARSKPEIERAPDVVPGLVSGDEIREKFNLSPEGPL